MLKKLLASAIITTTMATSAMADITLVVPQKVGAGTSVWAQTYSRSTKYSWV